MSKENDNTIVIDNNDVEATGNMSTSAQTDLDATNIGIHSVLTMHFWEHSPEDMWEIADAFRDEMRKTKGLEDVLVDWDYTDETEGFFTITSPWKGENSTALATESPNSGYDYTLTGRPFSKVGGQYTIIAGSGTILEDFLTPVDRWIKIPAPGQPKAHFDPEKMPIQMVRDFPPADTYRNNIMAEGRFGYWRLGDLALTGTGDGLTGNYYDHSDFTAFFATQIDTTVDFDFGTGAPLPGMGVDWFSIRWTGEVKPEFSETYTFYVEKDSGARLWVNDVLIIDAWPFKVEEVSGAIALTAATRYDIRLDFRDRYLEAKCHLKWSSASQAKQVIPQVRLYSAASAGGTALDETGRNPGNYIDTPTLGVTGAIANDSDTAVTFNGSSEYVNVGTLTTFGSQLSTGITLEAWVNPTSTSPDAIMGTRDLTGGSNQEIFFGIPSAGKLEFLITDNNDLTAQFRVETPTIATGVWTHVVVTWHPQSPNECHMFINGDEVITTRILTEHTATFSFIDLTIDFYIGGENNDGGAMAAAYAWSGSLDEVIIYSRVLTPTTILKHYLSGTGSSAAFFRLDTIDWTGRFTGDDITNPLPKLIEEERAISDIGFHRNRLVLVGDDKALYSAAGDFFVFFLEDADNLADADPIEAALGSGGKIAIIDFVTSFGKRQVFFTKAGQQFETNAPESFTHATADISASTSYKTQVGVRPAPLQHFLFFVSEENGSSQMLEYFFSEADTTHTAVDTTKHCRGYLPSSVQALDVCLNEDAVLLIEPDGFTVYVYRYYWDAGKKIQAAWAKYIFDATERIVNLAVIKNDCYLLIEDADGLYYVTSFTVPPDVAVSGWEYLVHLDNRVTSTGVHAGGTTTWTLTVSDETLTTAVLGPAFGDDSGTEVALTMVSGTSYTAAGDYSAGSAQLGRTFTMNAELSRPYIRNRNGAAILNMSLRLLKLVTNHIDTGQYTIRVAQTGRVTRDTEFTPRDGSILEAEGNQEVYLLGRADDTTVSIRDESALPVTISGGEYAANLVQRNR